MAITQNTFNGNGSNLGPFTFTFKWIQTADIKVTVGGVLKTAGTHYNLQNLNYTTKTGGEILFTAGNAPPAGTNNVRVYRDTSNDTLSSTFSSGSAIRASDLNTNFTQTLHTVQEIDNNAVNIDGSNLMVGNLNLNSFKAINSAVPTSGTDLTNKTYVDDRVSTSAVAGSPYFLQDGTGAVNRSWSSKLKDVVSVKDFGAVGDGVADDTAAINAAISACRAAGGGTVVFPTASYVIRRRIVGSQAGSIYLPPKVNLDFNNSTLLLQDNCSIIEGRGISNGKTMTITADVAANSRVLTVNSTSGVNAGDLFFVRLINNQSDAVETKWSYWVRVVSVDSATQVTVDVPAPEAMTVASTNDYNRRLSGFSERLENCYIKNVRLIQSTGGNAESGIDLFQPVNVLVENVYAENPGPGVVMIRYGDSCTFRNIWVSESISQNGQASKGRVLNFWNCHNCVFENIKGECFQNVAVFAESYCRNCVIRNSEWHNTWLYRKGTAKTDESLFFVGQGSEVFFEHTTIYGRGSTAVLFTSGGTTARNPFTNLFLRLDSKIKGGLFLSDWVGGRFVDSSSSVDVAFSSVKRASRRGTYFNNMSDATYTSGFLPPRGIVLNGWYHLNSKTGLGDHYIKRGAATILMTAASLLTGARTQLPSSFYGYGTDYPWNIPNQSGQYAIYTSTVNADTQMTWEYLYVPVGNEDDTLARVQGVDA